MAESVLNAPPGYRWLKCLTNWLLEGDHLRVGARDSAGEEVAVSFSYLAKGIWRMQLAPGGDPVPELRILTHELVALPIELEEGEGSLTARAGGTALQIQYDPWCVSWQDDRGRVICRENPYDVDGLNRLFVLPLGYVCNADGSVAYLTESFHLSPEERLFGLGEKFTRLDKVGQRIVSWTVDALGAASERSYKNVPFLISSRGYGLWINTGRRCVFDLGTQSCESYTLRVDGPYLDLFLMRGETPAQVIEAYVSLTGRAPVPPKWSFGLWLSGSGAYRDDAGIRTLVQGLEKHDLPCDVVHIDPWWMRWRKYADYLWDTKAFPDPQRLIDELHDQGLHLSLWQHPYISVESDLFTEGQQQGYFALRPDGEVYIIDYGLSLSTLPGGVTELADGKSSWNAQVAILDLTNSEAVEWYKSLMRPVLKQGIEVFKTDFGEDIPFDARFANGFTGAEMHNLYPLYYNQVVYEVTREVTGTGIVWSRSGWSGSQRYPTCWSGDPACSWDSMAFTLRGGLSLGLSGVPFWSHDVGGYRGHPSQKLYIRWAQFGMFCSHTRCHGESQREPWFYGEPALDIFRRYARLRYQLFPYLYACAYEASQSGLPVIRAMALSFPQDPSAYDQDLQYMLGPWLLVAPIFNEHDHRSVYLPDGKWVDYWTGEVHSGPRHIDVAVPLDRLPLYVRKGAVIPMMQPANRIPLDYIDPMILDIYPSSKFGYSFHEDEGVTRIEGVSKQAGLTMAWESPVSRSFILQWHLDWEPSRVSFATASGEEELPWEAGENGVIRVLIPACSAASLQLEMREA